MKALVALIKAVLRAFYAIYFPVRLIGEENIPASGGVILCANHIAARDPIILLLRLRRKVVFMAKKELFLNKFVGAVLKEGGAFPVDRGRADIAAIRESLRVLKDGMVLGIFPQGTRSAENERTHVHGGAALIEQRAKAPVVPVYIAGPYRAFRKTSIYIGKPVDLERFGTRSDGAAIDEVTEQIDGAIWRLRA